MPKVGYDMDGVIAIPTRAWIHTAAKITNFKPFWTLHARGCAVGLRPKEPSWKAIIITGRPLEAHFETWLWLREQGISQPLVMAPGFLPDPKGRAHFKALAIQAHGVKIYWEDDENLGRLIRGLMPSVKVNIYKGRMK